MSSETVTIELSAILNTVTAAARALWKFIFS